MRGLDPEQPAQAGRNADRAVGIRSECEAQQSSRDCRRRSARGTARGAMSDADGNFKYLVVAADPDAVELEVKYLGMETQVVTLGSRSRLDIQLEEAQNELEQVVT